MPDRVVVIGDPRSVFVQTPVRFWRDRGIDTLILTSRWSGPEVVDGDLPVVAAETLAPAAVVTLARGLYPVLDAADASLQRLDPARTQAALRTWADSAVPPSVAPPIFDALLIAAAADRLSPTCVFGHEAFAYGLATGLATAPRRALMAWGADVLHFAHMNDVALAMVGQSLAQMTYVLTNTPVMERALVERFALPPSRVARISYGVDRRLFHRADQARQRRVRAAYGIPHGARVVMNLRRFLPHWGSPLALDAMLTVAARRPDVHLVLLDGSGDAGVSTTAVAAACRRGLAQRLTVVHGHVPLPTVADLMAIADVGLSLVASLEPVSWSVQQAAASGVATIVADQESYALESERGLAVHRQRDLDAPAVAKAVSALLDDPVRAASMAAANARYVDTHHDRERELTRLLRIVAGGEAADRMLSASPVGSAVRR